MFVEKLEEDVIRNMARFAAAEICTVCSFFGGIAAQEAFKIVGKYHPIHQWLHYDCFESLPPQETVNRTLLNCRYDDQIAIYGQELQEKLASLKLLMIGAGALGCEFIKAFSLMGICCNKGLLTVTDNDHIELSNLNRQFLFRQKDIGHSKSQVASGVGMKANPTFRAKDMKDFVAATTEHIFTEEIWDNLDAIIGAVDNIKARMYIDSKCVWHNKPFLDSGTLGTKANTQVVYPGLTQSYSDTIDPQEDSYPMCTIRNFPNIIEHTIEWGRNQFEGLFGETPKNAIEYLKGADAFLKQVASGTTITGTIEILKSLKELIILKKKNSFDACIAFARERFHNLFNCSIAQLLFTFPPDYKDQNGIPFWTGPKRAPSIIELDMKDELHMMFIRSLANILSVALHIPCAKECKEPAYIAKVTSSVKLAPFVPKKVAIQTDDKEPVVSQSLGDEDKELEDLKKELIALCVGLKPSDFESIEFEKDDETNFHVDYIHSTANLRARNYKIQECDKLRTRGVAGHIIPAIATATAMIVGCMTNELIKVAQKFSKIDFFKNAFVNLALPLFVFSEPAEVNKITSKEMDPVMGGPVKAVPEGHTKWQKIEIKGPQRLSELMEYVKKNYAVDVTMVVCGELPLYMAGMSPKDRLNKNIEDIVVELGKNKLPPTTKSLRIDIMGETLDKKVSVVMPSFKYHLK